MTRRVRMEQQPGQRAKWPGKPRRRRAASPDARRVIGSKRTPDWAPTLASGLSGLSTHKGWGGLPPYRPILRPPR
jgi:hypothetical protein